MNAAEVDAGIGDAVLVAEAQRLAAQGAPHGASVHRHNQAAKLRAQALAIACGAHVIAGPPNTGSGRAATATTSAATRTTAAGAASACQRGPASATGGVNHEGATLGGTGEAVALARSTRRGAMVATPRQHAHAGAHAMDDERRGAQHAAVARQPDGAGAHAGAASHGHRRAVQAAAALGWALGGARRLHGCRGRWCRHGRRQPRAR